MMEYIKEQDNLTRQVHLLQYVFISLKILDLPWIVFFVLLCLAFSRDYWQVTPCSLSHCHLVGENCLLLLGNKNKILLLSSSSSKAQSFDTGTYPYLTLHILYFLSYTYREYSLNTGYCFPLAIIFNAGILSV